MKSWAWIWDLVDLGTIVALVGTAYTALGYFVSNAGTTITPSNIVIHGVSFEWMIVAILGVVTGNAIRTGKSMYDRHKPVAG